MSAEKYALVATVAAISLGFKNNDIEGTFVRKNLIAEAILAVAVISAGAGYAVGKLTSPGATSKTAAVPEAEIKKKLESSFHVKIERFEKSPIPGLYEIFARDGISYTDVGGNFVIARATVINANTKENVTVKRLQELTAISFKDFPLSDAIKTVKGKGSRQMVTFEDPNCGYCKQLNATLEGIDDVTIYTFLMPILSEDSVTKAKQIWCSADRAAAWHRQMVDKQAPEGKGDCETPIERNLALAEKLHINGTPAMFFPSGSRIPGASLKEGIENALSGGEAKK